ncbi:serine/threonine protein kinase [Actinomadura rugatobispora]|uniref:non-specific serine/threonine protein kinase n=1 Tax=Actinomadura rugatobispora TaxID=1994 RepID=A0ABW1AED8_9ACTN|nr:hypothetical protein GCM10010200_033930 [Actinomadura rugatobispora]
MSGDGDAPSLLPGYRELSVIRRSAGAVTYRAVHEESGDAVTVRVQRDGGQIPQDDLDALGRASRDERALTVLGTGMTTTGRRYVTLPHHDGTTYSGGGPMPVRQAVEVAAAAGRALQALHDEGLVHGDVHPGNILRGVDGPLLTGAATLRGLAAHSALGVLDPVDLDRVDAAHAAPEALRRQRLTAAADVYGLGAALWTLLAGRPPYTGDDLWTIRKSALNQPVPPLPRDDVPGWLVSALGTATAPEPGDRFPSAAAFVRTLADGLGELPAPAEPPRPVPPPPGPSRDWDRLPGWSWGEDGIGGDDGHRAAEPAPEATERRRGPLGGPSRPRRRVGPVVAAVVALAVVGAGIGVTGLLSGGRTAEEPPRAAPSVPTSTPTAVRPAKEYLPGRVRIVDGRVSIEVSWEDRSGGRAAHYVVGGPEGRPASTLASAPAGTEKVVVTALNPSVDYCLTVVAVVDVDRVAHAEPVCTRRVKRG